MRTGGTSYYFLTDAQGSVVGLVNSAGTRVDTYTYDPTGQARSTTETVPQPYRFQGTYLDPTGLYKMGARYYDPTLGRFTQTDPSGKETNPYLFAGADPVNHTDPTGTGFLSSALEALGNGSDILDGISLGDDLYNKDWGAAYAKAMGIAAGALTGTACGLLVAAAAPESAGASLAASGFCVSASLTAGTWIEGEVGS